MTGKIFVPFMRKMNNQFKAQKRQVAIILDNCSAYPPAELTDFSNIKFFFLPPNTTSASQPMDAGIIKNMKVLYKKRLVKQRLICLEDNSKFSWSLLDALYALKVAWQDVKPSTIQNWFRKTSFVIEEHPSIIEETANATEFTNLFERMTAMLGIEVSSLFSNLRGVAKK